MLVGRVRGALVDDLGDAVGEWAVDDVGVAGDPADVGGAPVHVLLGLVVEDVVVGVRRLGEVAAGGVDDALGLSGGAGGVEDEQRVLGVERLRMCARSTPASTMSCHHRSRPSVHVDVDAGAADDQHVLDGCRTAVDRFVDGVLEGGGLAAAPLPVGGDDQLGFGVVDARAQRAGGEAGEHHRVGRAEAGAGEHGDDGLGDHRHVDRDAVAGDEAEVGEGVGGLADFGEQVVVGEVAGVARFALQVDGDAVAVAGEDVAVDAVVGDVELCRRRTTSRRARRTSRGPRRRCRASAGARPASPRTRDGPARHRRTIPRKRSPARRIQPGRICGMFGEGGQRAVGVGGHWRTRNPFWWSEMWGDLAVRRRSFGEAMSPGPPMSPRWLRRPPLP